MRLLRKPLTWVVLGGLGVIAAVGLYLFQPWKLWVDERVDEALPVLTTPSSTPAEPTPAEPSRSEPLPVDPPPTGPSSVGPSSVGPSSVEPPTSRTPEQVGNREIARGTLISHEHSTSGTVRLVELANGDRVLTLEKLDTSNGPDLKVWITDAPVIAGGDGWHVFDDGDYVNLGDLKGNLGNQVYAVPGGVDFTKLTSVSIWCDRFNVSFGAAELIAV